MLQWFVFDWRTLTPLIKNRKDACPTQDRRALRAGVSVVKCGRQANGLMQTFGALKAAVRQSDLAWEGRSDFIRRKNEHEQIDQRWVFDIKRRDWSDRNDDERNAKSVKCVGNATGKTDHERFGKRDDHSCGSVSCPFGFWIIRSLDSE